MFYRVISAIGGTQAAIVSAKEINPHVLNLFKNPDGSTLGFWAIASLMAWGLGYPGMPHIITRFMAIRDADETKRARRIAIFWVFLGLFCAVLIGVLGMTYLKDSPLKGADEEKVFMVLIQAIFHPALGAYSWQPC